MRAQRLRAFAFATLVLFAPLTGCMQRTMTAAELRDHGTRRYAGWAKPELMKASVVGLRTLGYQVTVADAATGRIKTAPKTVAVHAYAVGYTAAAIEDMLAWTVDVTTSKEGTVVHATPRGYRNGQATDENTFVAAYMDRAFADLFKEIESNRGSAAGDEAPTAPGPKGAAPAKTSAPGNSSGL